jgi:hypothetical protein
VTLAKDPLSSQMVAQRVETALMTGNWSLVEEEAIQLTFPG